MSESIKVITGPSVYLIGRQTIDDAALDRFLADEGVAAWSTDTEVAGEKLVEVAGRLCYMSFSKPRPGGNAAYLGHILEVAHGSVLEHAVFNLIVTGVSRSLTHELVRHRAGFGFSQLSQRYVDEVQGGNRPLDVVEPPLIAECRAVAVAYCREKGVPIEDVVRCQIDPDPLPWAACSAVWHWDRIMGRASGAYARIDRDLDCYLRARGNRDPFGEERSPTVIRKAAREAARSVLTNATETKIFLTGNARALRHFVEMRADAGADAEIRRLAIAVLGVLQEAAPNLFGDYQVSGDPPGATTPHRKV
jgi:thymidylate synthase (FAD)